MDDRFEELIDSIHKEKVFNEMQKGTHLKNWSDWLHTRIKGDTSKKIKKEYMDMCLKGIKENFELYLKQLK